MDSLNNTNWQSRENAVYDILMYNVYGAKEIFEQRMWDTLLYPKEWIIETLYQFNSNKTLEYALAYIDTLDYKLARIDTVNDPYYENRSLYFSYQEIQADLARVLFKLNNYSKVDKVVDLWDRDTINVNISVFYSLKYLMKKFPELYEERGKRELEKIIFDKNSSHSDKYFSLESLRYVYGNEVLPLVIKVFLEDEDVGSRTAFLSYLVDEYPRNSVEPFLKERLYSDTNKYILNEIAAKLLQKYLTISNYKYVKTYWDTHPDIADSTIIDLELTLFFKPQEPEKVVPVQVMIDTLNSYIQQLLNYNWLDNNLSIELTSILNKFLSYLTNDDSLMCARQIKSFQQTVNFELNDSLNTTSNFVTEDAWKFLYYYSQYILDRLPDVSKNLRKEDDGG
ncbi:MAG: hypothetical protein C4539_09245 [Ignavibacteriales bacterium]|nr:MAG: hypothetical protein C4539_09245 [Ignavibacteriales bacterium]